jgi:hypothetical protein
MGSIPNGSAPLQACARQIFNSMPPGRTGKAQVLNDLCKLQTHCVLYVVFTKHRSEALNPMILPLTSKDLQDITRLILN